MNFTKKNIYENIDRSTRILIDEEHQFSVLTIDNYSAENKYFSYHTEHNYIQLFFSLDNACKVAFNMEHCAVPLDKDESCMVYYKDESMNLLFEMTPNSHLVIVFIPVQYFHSLFTLENNYLLNFDSFKLGKPIIEKKETTPTQQVVLHQLLNSKEKSPLHNLYIKGKVYELFSLYFDTSRDNDKDVCPFMSNEETMGQLKNVKNTIIENMADPPSLEELSKMAGINLKKLKEGFKEVYGAPVFTFLLNYKLEYSKKLLLENKMNVNEIGLRIGYSTSSHFIAAFKRKYGITPKQFTKQNSL